MKSKLMSLKQFVTPWRRASRQPGVVRDGVVRDVTSLEQHEILPYATPWVGGPSPHGLPDYGRMRHGNTFVDEFPENVTSEYRQLKGRCLYGGPFMNHFGCVMVYSVARLWAFDPGKHKAVVFSFCPQKRMPKLPNWARSIFEYLGVNPDRVVIARNPVRIERLDVSEPGSEFKKGPTEWYLNHLKRRQVNTGFKLSDKLYFGRTHIKQQGTSMGESYFETLILKSGFRYIKPEDFSLADQLSALQNSKQAIFAEGSAIYLYELLYSTDTKCFMLPRRTRSSILFEPYVTPRGEFHRLGGDTAFERLPDANNINGPKSASYCMNPKSIFDDLQKQGLIHSHFNFDWESYEHCERQDTLEYYGDANLQYAQSQLSEVKNRRKILK